MRIPKGFIKDSEGIYRRGNFVFRDNKIFRESAIVPKGTIEEVADNYTTVSECIRAILAFPASIGEKPRTTDIYVNKVGNNFKQSDKFTKDTVAIVTSDRNVIDIKAKDISDSTEFKDLISKDKPVKAKQLKTFGELKESAEKYVNQPGVCPKCKEQDLDYGAIELEGEMAYFPYKCHQCGQEGEEWYSMDFAGHNIYDENGELIELTESSKSKSKIKESAEGVNEFWDKFDKGEVKIGDKFENGPELLKANKKADYILVFKNDEYVAAWAPELSGGDLVWGQGHYFDNEKDAEEYFNSKLNESEKLKKN